jgi:hypothetical protein
VSSKSATHGIAIVQDVQFGHRKSILRPLQKKGFEFLSNPIIPGCFTTCATPNEKSIVEVSRYDTLCGKKIKRPNVETKSEKGKERKPHHHKATIRH